MFTVHKQSGTMLAPLVWIHVRAACHLQAPVFLLQSSARAEICCPLGAGHRAIPQLSAFTSTPVTNSDSSKKLTIPMAHISGGGSCLSKGLSEGQAPVGRDLGFCYGFTEKHSNLWFYRQAHPAPSNSAYKIGLIIMS